MLEHLLQAIVEDPQAEDRWSVLADWLEEYDDPRRAELLRLHRQLLATCCQPDMHPERAYWQARLVAMLAEGVKPCVPQQTVMLAEGVEFTFSFIPPGSFLMGSSPQEEGRRDNETLHLVTLPSGFWMGGHQVTQAQWAWAMRRNPSRFQGDNRPVESVSWGDCQQFCRQLDERTGRRFRLPSEAEWERACRAGSTTAYHPGDGLEALKQTGWCRYDGYRVSPGYLEWDNEPETKPVAQYDSNAFGLYDMHGNVWEWCSDWYRRHHEEGDPVSASMYGPRPMRVIRGGCYMNEPSPCRSACRNGNDPDIPVETIGCRIVLCPD
jgi:uncharacterized protein (TIGR02996 family)